MKENNIAAAANIDEDIFVDEWDEDRFPDSPDDPGSDEEFEAYCLSRPLPEITLYKEPEDDDLPF